MLRWAKNYINSTPNTPLIFDHSHDHRPLLLKPDRFWNFCRIIWYVECWLCLHCKEQNQPEHWLWYISLPWICSHMMIAILFNAIGICGRVFQGWVWIFIDNPYQTILICGHISLIWSLPQIITAFEKSWWDDGKIREFAICY